MISKTERLGKPRDEIANLAVGVVAGGIKERRREFDFERFGALNQIHERRRRNGQIFENFRCGLRQLGLGLDKVGIRLGVFDQRRRGADLAREERGGFGGEASLRG